MFITYYLQIVLVYSPVLAGARVSALTASIVIGSRPLSSRLLPRAVMGSALLVAVLSHRG
ncbi:hypothetical protein [Streptomyces xiaopingdaonensis]|uniref:hypothetical protein n=1 Tax=Streptomyces xiaopingdaonensis TaxID=1565415 RepID=UPI0012FF194C|nr:hypothetical protein [Streptomyces xiaopingdaonensis]